MAKLKIARCGFCKKDITKHTPEDLKIHTWFRNGYTQKLRVIMFHEARDKRLLARALQRTTDKKTFEKTLKRLRYPIDIRGFIQYGTKGHDEQMLKKLGRSKTQ